MVIGCWRMEPIGSVTKMSRGYGSTGTSTPAMAPISRDHAPAQSNTCGVAKSPSVVLTPAMRAPSLTMAVAATRSMNFTPSRRPAPAYANVTACALAMPSLGQNVAPRMSSPVTSGARARTWAGSTPLASLMSCASQMGTPVIAALDVVSVGAHIAFDADRNFFAWCRRLESSTAAPPRRAVYGVYALRARDDGGCDAANESVTNDVRPRRPGNNVYRG